LILRHLRNHTPSSSEDRASFANNGLGRGVAMKKILVIEDEDSLRLAIMAVLRK
jgi:hypothetical protein